MLVDVPVQYADPRGLTASDEGQGKVRQYAPPL